MPISMRVVIVGVAALLLLSALAATAQSPSPVVAKKEAVERGRYLVQNVAMCGYCHSPRDSKGRVIQYKAFHGAVIPVSPPTGEDWALVAPSNLGFVGYTDEEAVQLLTTGIKHDGTKTKPPMPPYKLKKEDAEAVVAFLRSLR